MALTLEQYANLLDNRPDLSWPAPPEPDRPKARPYLVRLEVRAVLWNIYGTLLNLLGGELYFEHPQKFIMDVALDKTIQEFKMWGSMSRKPGHPADYLRQVYGDLLHKEKSVLGGNEKHPEILSERIWEAFIKRLLQKDYKFDAGSYGALNEYSRKVAYFFHASLQGTACYAGAAMALRELKARGLRQGLLADAQSFTLVQLQRGLLRHDPTLKVDQLFHPDLRSLSCDIKGRKPSERLFRHALEQLEKHDIAPEEVLHVGSRLAQDIAPARKLGMKTALFAGDKGSLAATPEQLKDPATRPDVLLTELPQIVEVVGSH